MARQAVVWHVVLGVLLAGSLGMAQGIREISTTVVIGAGKSQPAGQYQTPKAFSVPFSFEIKQPFDARFERMGRFEVFGLTRGKAQSGNATHWMMVFALPVGTTPANALEALKSTRSLNLGQTREGTIGAVTATYLDATAKTDQPQADPAIPAGSVVIPAIGQLIRMDGLEWFTESPQASLRFVVLEHKGRTLLIYIETPKGEFEGFVGELELVLASIKFAP